MNILWFLCLLSSGIPPGFDESVSNQLRVRVEQQAALGNLPLLDENLHSQILLPKIYQERFFRPIWFESGTLKANFPSLLGILETAVEHGLEGETYHLNRLKALSDQWKTVGKQNALLAVEMDLLATDGFLMFVTHLASGSVDRERIGANWRADRAEIDPADFLTRAMVLEDLSALFQELHPTHPHYRSLQDSLAFWREQPQPSMDPFKFGPAIKPLQHHDQIPALRQLLLPSSVDSPVYDGELVSAVRNFQENNGLNPDGIVGDGTRWMLNLKPVDRINLIRANLERWRWLPRNLGTHHIIVNIAAYSMQVVDQGNEVLSMDVIVGRPFRETPVFSAEMTYLVLSPFWNVPPSLIEKDKLPVIKKNPEKLKAQGFRAFDGWGADAAELDLMTVGSKLTGGNKFPYRLRQDPGPLNALGDVKFMFPNPYNVYLHDTPDRELFKKSERSFSSGCIRISRPIDLAVYLLGRQDKWTRERILETIAARREVSVPLSQRYRVHLLYWTVFVKGGQVCFALDIYDRDKKLIQALNGLNENG